MYDFVAIDFETANWNPSSACSVGIVAVKELQIIKTDHFLIKPPTKNFNEVNVRINGIDYNMVKDSGSFADIYPRILEYINNTRVVMAHNASFDMNVLYECVEYYQLESPDFIYIDTINFSIPMKCDCGNSLEDCANYFDINLSEHHNALCDAKACAAIAIESIKRSDANNLAEYVLFYPEVNHKRFSELQRKHTAHSHSKKIPHYVSPSSINTTVTHFDTSNAFYQKNCVITGELVSMSRREAMQKIADSGGINKSSVSSKTDYLIIGIQDKKLVGDDGLSTKQEKAYSLIAKGARIKIIDEKEFIELLKA